MGLFDDASDHGAQSASISRDRYYYDRHAGPPNFMPQQTYSRATDCNDFQVSQQRDFHGPPEAGRNAGETPRDIGPRKEKGEQGGGPNHWKAGGFDGERI